MVNKMEEKQIYPWHQKNWLRLQKMGTSLPHALIFHGPEGTGIEDFAEIWAKTLLCENRHDESSACGRCSSCRWFDQGSHPDYQRLTPDALDPDPESGTVNSDTSEDTSNKKTKQPSKKIPIDAIRQLHDFVNITTHRGGFRVILIYPAEAMTMEASNAVLKMLEEPPANTFFLLITNQLGALLPTILSRCGKLAFPLPDKAEALAWLEQQQIKDPDIWLAEQGGAPLAALKASETDTNNNEHAILLDCLALPNLTSVLKTAEQLQKIPVKQSIIWMQRWLYDLVSKRQADTIRYHPRQHQAIERLASKADLPKLLMATKQMVDRRKTAEYPLVPRLVLEDMLLDYLKIFSDQHRLFR
ncbi:MAG: DNA polymerase III subunit delta' [Oxalobacter sp.]|nr:DNA polymerase III subunit delta' [Oxalobacter sp.]